MGDSGLQGLKQLCARLRRLLISGEGDLRPAAGLDEEEGAAWMVRLAALRCLESRGLWEGPPLHEAEPPVAGLARWDRGLEEAFRRAEELLPPLFQAPAWKTHSALPWPVAHRCLALLSESPDHLFRPAETLGWLYQLWQSHQRARIFARVLGAAPEKIQGREVIAATQLYTPGPMAQFLVANSLGALWRAMHPEAPLAESWPFFARQARLQPLAPKDLRQITVLDPACGTGHLLLEAFDRLDVLYQESAPHLSPEERCRAILQENLHGLDIDGRAVALAQAALWLKAVSVAPGIPFLPAPLSSFEACSADQASVIGSLLRPRDIAASETCGSLLSRGYDVVLSNPPYLSNRQMGDVLRSYVRARYPSTATDLYVCFLARLEELTRPGGFQAVVCPQGWTTLGSFARFRAAWLRRNSLTTLVSLGQRAFEEASLLFIGLATSQKAAPPNDHRLAAWRLDRLPGSERWSRLAELCRATGSDPAAAQTARPPQEAFTSLPSTPIIPFVPARFLELLNGRGDALGDHAAVVAGIDTGENGRFVRYSWEIGGLSPERWRPYTKGKGFWRWTAPNITVVDWDRNGARLRAHPGATIRNSSYHFREGLEYSYVFGGKVSCRLLSASLLDHGAVGVFPHSERERWLILSLLNARTATVLARSLSPSLNLPVGCAKRLPFPASAPPEMLERLVALAQACTALKGWLMVQATPVDLAASTSGPPFVSPPSETPERLLEQAAVAAVLHHLEGVNEQVLSQAFSLTPADRESLRREVGDAPGSFALLEGLDRLPPLPARDNRPLSAAWTLAADSLSSHPRRAADRAERRLLRQSVEQRWLREPGIVRFSLRGLPPNEALPRSALPNETWVEELACRHTAHPLSVFCTLQQFLSDPGARLPSLPRRDAWQAWLSVKLFEVLGISATGPSSFPPDDPEAPWGVVPLTPVPGVATVGQRLAGWSSGQPLEEALGMSLDEWLHFHFFRFHLERFRHRPLVWHLQSSPPHPGSRPLFACLISARQLNAGTLPRIRERLVRPLLDARETHQPGCRKDELHELADRLQRVIAEGFATATNSPGSVAYRPNPHDGIRVNLAPLQRAGLLACPVLPVRDVERALCDRARWRSGPVVEMEEGRLTGEAADC